MKCYYHQDREAESKCDVCEKQICKECGNNQEGRIICDECLVKEAFGDEDTVIIEEKNNSSNTDIKNTQFIHNNYQPVRKIPNSFLGFIFSLVPGAGHMYLGLMRRGLQLMLTFFGLLVIPNILNFAEFTTLLATVVWFYSVFDAYHIRNKLIKGEIIKDELIVEVNHINMNYYYVGIGLLIFGVLALLNQAFYSFQYIFNIPTVSIFFKSFRLLREILLPILLIIAGIILIRRSKKK